MDSECDLQRRRFTVRPRLPGENFFHVDGRGAEEDEMQRRNRFARSEFEMSSRRSDLPMPRTTSMHRNSDLKYDRTLNRKLEERMGWMRPAGGSMVINPLEQHADHIVSCMEQDEALMEDTPISEQLRIEALRDMPQCLTVKRHIKVKLSRSVSRKSKRKHISFYKRTKYRMSIMFTKFKNNLKTFLYSFELWYNSLKMIEGHFGSAVATHFKFLRWLFIINFLIAVVTVVLVVLPQMCFSFFVEPGNGTEIDSGAEDTNGFQFKDIFTGAGFFTNTTLFYGFYTNGMLTWGNVFSYHMPYAYFFTMFCIYLVCFIILSMSMATSYRRSFIQTEGGLKNVYAHKVFCGWDFKIATKEAAKLKSVGIYQELKELLSDMSSNSKKKSFIQRFWKGILHSLVNAIIVAFLAGIGYGLWQLLEMHSNDVNYVELNSLITALVVNAIMLLVPIILSIIGRHEGYNNPKTALVITLLRIFLLEIVVLGVLLVYWLGQARSKHCWETLLGQEIYRLILFDFLIAIVLTTILEAMRLVCFKFMSDKIGLPEFDIAGKTQQLIYNQTLFWIGLFFSPWLAVIVVLKLLGTWHVRKISLVYFCKPSTKSWRASQTQTWFFIMSFITLLLIFALYGFVLVEIPTSNCGPFRDYPFIYQMVLQGAFQLKSDHEFWKVIMFVTKPGVIALILIAMCVKVYYLRAKSHAQRGMVALLREMLVWESRDKEFLLKYISQVTRGQWQYNLKESRGSVMDPSHVSPAFAQEIRERRTREQEFPRYSRSLSTPVAEPDFLSRYKQTG